MLAIITQGSVIAATVRTNNKARLKMEGVNEFQKGNNRTIGKDNNDIQGGQKKRWQGAQKTEMGE